MIEDRPQRPARTRAEAASLLLDEVDGAGWAGRMSTRCSPLPAHKSDPALVAALVRDFASS